MTLEIKMFPAPAVRRHARRAVALAGGDVNRIVRHVHHGEIIDGDVFHDAAVHLFERQAAATAESAVGHGAVAETAARLGAEFDAAVVVPAGFHRAVNQGALLKTGDLAVHDREIFRQAQFAERIGAFRAKPVVVRRIDAAVGNRRVAAAVNVNAVAVGVHRHVVHGQIVAAGDENGKMAAVKNRDVADENISAELQRDGFVAEADGSVGRFRAVGGEVVQLVREADHLVEQLVGANQPAAVDGAVAGDENIRQVFAPDEAVVKITMSAVLIRDCSSTAR